MPTGALADIYVDTGRILAIFGDEEDDEEEEEVKPQAAAESTIPPAKA